jgi:hypothetical protein
MTRLPGLGEKAKVPMLARYRRQMRGNPWGFLNQNILSENLVPSRSELTDGVFVFTSPPGACAPAESTHR